MPLKYIKNLDSRIFSKKKKGFSFLEVMISVFIFFLMMTTVSMTFASLFRGYRNSKAIQQNLENAQFAMNTMAKSLRTSSIISSTVSSVMFFNYSGGNGSCNAYRWKNSNSLQVASAPCPVTNVTTQSKIDWCTNKVFINSDFLDIIPSNVNSVAFYVVPSSLGVSPNPSVMGKVTISIEVCASASCTGSVKDRAKIQSSVSLRDYNTVEL